MPVTTSSAQPRRPDGPITLGEWNKIMSTLLRIVERELASIEKKQNSTKGDGYVELTDADTRRVLTITRAVERTQIINEKVKLDGASDQDVKDFKDNEQARETLQRRLNKVVERDEA